MNPKYPACGCDVDNNDSIRCTCGRDIDVFVPPLKDKKPQKESIKLVRVSPVIDFLFGLFFVAAGTFFLRLYSFFSHIVDNWLIKGGLILVLLGLGSCGIIIGIKRIYILLWKPQNISIDRFDRYTVLGILCIFVWAIIYWGQFGSIHKGNYTISAPSNSEKITEESLIELVDVRKLDLQINTPSKTYFDKALWDLFANNPHESIYDLISTKNWKQKRSDFRAKLLEKARGKGLDFQSLEKCLKKIEKEQQPGLAVVPIAAYLIKNNWRDAWVIPCKWEYAGPDNAPSGKDKYMQLGHISVWAMRASSQRILGYTTCR